MTKVRLGCDFTTLGGLLLRDARLPLQLDGIGFRESFCQCAEEPAQDAQESRSGKHSLQDAVTVTTLHEKKRVEKGPDP
jgi:hypothetical protein